jgi:hypothetical protein
MKARRLGQEGNRHHSLYMMSTCYKCCAFKSIGEDLVWKYRYIYMLFLNFCAYNSLLTLIRFRKIILCRGRM